MQMRWTLRTMLAVITVIGYAIAGTTTFGIAATATSILILGAAWIAYSRTSNGRRPRWALSVLCAITALTLYVGTFLVFRVFRTFEFSLAPTDDPQHNIVVFSLEPAAQEIARRAYNPLINLIPGHCIYPTGSQMELLNHDPFTGKRMALYW